MKHLTCKKPTKILKKTKILKRNINRGVVHTHSVLKLTCWDHDIFGTDGKYK